MKVHDILTLDVLPTFQAYLKESIFKEGKATRP